MMSSLEQVLSKTFTDQTFRREVIANPEGVASEYGLTTDDLAALRLLHLETWSEDLATTDEVWPDEGIITRYA